MKTCPYCAEEIQDAAIRCRWCHSWLVEDPPASADTKPMAAAESPAAEPEMAEAAVAGAVAAEAVTDEPSDTAPMEAVDTAEAEPAAEEAAPAADVKTEFTHTGTRYLLGYGADYFGIWDRNAPQQPIERFPRNDEGWANAWQRYSSMETNWMDLRTGQKSS